MQISIILGTRPEIIKLSPIIRECIRHKDEFYILHTGQHYSYNMDRVFFNQLELPKARFNLEVGSGTHAQQTGKMLMGIEKVLKETSPDVVLVQGDTNTVLAGALAAVKLDIKVGHVEAGLRSYDRKMPEEINRLLADHCSDFLFAPTLRSKEILQNEDIPAKKIHVTGNTIVDAIFQNLEIINRRAISKNQLDFYFDEYFIATVHRSENVDNANRFNAILKGLEKVVDEFNKPIIYPIHPRAKKQLNSFKFKTNGLHLIEPLDYLSFLQLSKDSQLILTDSGGVQEEACVLGVPCITLRENTERPETLEVGANTLAGTNPSNILKCAKKMLQITHTWENPFGDGNAGEKIVQILREQYE